VITGLIIQMFQLLTSRSGTNTKCNFVTSLQSYVRISFQGIPYMYSYTNTDLTVFTMPVPGTWVPRLQSEVGWKFGILASYSEDPAVEPWDGGRLFLLATRLYEINSGLFLSYTSEVFIKILDIVDKSYIINWWSVVKWAEVSRIEKVVDLTYCLEINVFLFIG
jgi:hypothetical protein